MKPSIQRLFGAMNVLPGLLLLGSVSIPVQVLADEDDRFSVSLGVFVTDRDTRTRLDGSEGEIGSRIDFENDLGIDGSDSVFRVDGYFKFNDRHRLDFSTFNFSRNATKVIDRDIEWQGTVFPIDTTVRSGTDLEIYKLAYTYSLIRREKAYLGLTGGLYVADIGARLSADNIAAQVGGSVTAPLPVVGLRGAYPLGEKWTFRMSAEFFFLEYGDFDGSLVDLYASVDYQLFDRVAIGAGVNSVQLDVGVDKARFNGDVDWNYKGGLLFLKIDF